MYKKKNILSSLQAAFQQVCDVDCDTGRTKGAGVLWEEFARDKKIRNSPKSTKSFLIHTAAPAHTRLPAPHSHAIPCMPEENLLKHWKKKVSADYLQMK